MSMNPVSGALESIESGLVVGWACLLNASGTRLVVEILVEGRPVGTVTANRHRTDLAAAGFGDGRYGFQFALAAQPGERVRARLANTPFLLEGEIMVEAPAADVLPLTQGWVDQASGLTVQGWAWRPMQPGEALRVVARLLDGADAASAPVLVGATADEFRGDLAEAGIGDGKHAFTLRLPLHLADGRVHRVALSVEGEADLPGSPIEVLTQVDGPRAALMRLDQVIPTDRKDEAAPILALLDAYLRQTEDRVPQSLSWHAYPEWRRVQRPEDAEEGISGPWSRLFNLNTRLAGPLEVLVLVDAGMQALPGAVERAMQVLVQTGADILYADAEEETPSGLLPWFRPGWSPDHFLATDYTRGLFLVRAELIRALLPLPSIAHVKLAAVRAARSGCIYHLPEVLSRVVAPAVDGGEWLQAVQVHLEQKTYPADGRQAQVAALDGTGTYRRIHWPLPEPAPMVSLIIPTRDRVDLLRTCISSIRDRTTYPHYEILVIDNQSRDPETLQFLADEVATGHFRVLTYDAPFNFSDMNNKAAAAARGTVLGFINNDVELITPGWLEEAVGLLARPEVGAVGARLRFRNGMLQHAGVIVGVGGLAENAFQHLHANDAGYFFRTHLAGNYSAVTAATLFCRAETFLALGGFDAANLPVAFNDVDLCLRLRERGYSIVWTPHIELYHDESISRGADLTPDRRARAAKEDGYIRARWRAVLPADPYYNPNLNLDGRPFQGLALPPRRPWGALR